MMLLDTLHPPCTRLGNGGPSDVRLNMNFELPQKLFHGDVHEQQEASYAEEHFIRHTWWMSRLVMILLYFQQHALSPKLLCQRRDITVEYLVGMAMAMS